MSILDFDVMSPSMKKMNVVQILPDFDEGGVEGETLDFAVYLAERGHRSMVISAGGRMVDQLESAGGIHMEMPHIGEKSFRCLKYISQLRRIFLWEGIDVVHLRSRLPAWVGYLAWKTIPPGKRPNLVTTFHGFYSVNCYSAIMTKGERVVAVSRAIREHILEHYRIDGEKIEIIHGGCDIESFSPDAVSAERLAVLRREWQLPEDHTAVIVLPGRLTTWKGQHVFIESLAQLQELPFFAVCVGEVDEESSYVKQLRALISTKKLEGKIKLVGHCSDMPAALLAADFVVSASSSKPEAFGKVAIEAMAMERPVVATRHGGSVETVEENSTGWFVTPDNPSEMAEAIRKLLLNRELIREAGRKGRQRVLKHFTAERMCEKTLSLYEQLQAEKTTLRK